MSQTRFSYGNRRLPAAVQSRALLQAGFFTGATVLGSLLNGVTKVLLSHQLTVNAFGDYSFAVSFLQIGSMLFEFGLFMPIARLAARQPERRRELIGSGLVLYAPVALVFQLGILGASFVADSIFSVHAGSVLRASAPLDFVWPFAVIGLFFAQGVDRLHLISVTGPIASVLFSAVLGTALVTETRVSASVALLLSAATMAISYVPLLVSIRPIMSDWRADAAVLRQQAREYGFGVYVGRVLALGTYQMDVLMLGGFSTATVVAQYVLAGAIANTITTPSAGIGNALFGRMVSSNRVSRTWLASSGLLGVLGVFVTWALAGPFLGVLFPSSYRGATAFIVALAIAAALRGTTTIYNSFLAAQGRGRELRRAAYVLTWSNVVLNLTLIPAFGGEGAAWASALALLMNLLAHVYYYRRAIADTAAPPTPSRMRPAS